MELTYQKLVQGWKALRGVEGLRVREVACVGAPRTLLCVERGESEQQVVELSAGVHGDEPAGPWALLDFVERGMLDPRFAYRMVTVPEGERTGLLVWRLETIRRSVPEGREDVDRIARIVELLPASEENARRLLAAALGEMEAAGALGADFYGYHAGANRALEEAGFLDCGSIEDGERLPSRFQPLDGKGGGILSAMFLKEPAPGFAPPDSAWYWTKSDSDQDRPN